MRLSTAFLFLLTPRTRAVGKPPLPGRFSTAFLFLLALGAAARLVCAGESISGDTRQNAAEIEDIGEISEAPAGAASATPSKFHVNASASATYTTNAELSGRHSSSDLIFFPSIQAGYTTSLGHGFDFDLLTIIQTGLYVDHTDRSFAGYSAQASLDWRYKPNWPRIFVAAEPYRFDNYDRGSLITEAIGTLAGTDWGCSFNSGDGLFFIGYTFENDFSNPTSDNRASNRVVAGVTQRLRERLYGQLTYEYQYSHYQDVDRNDSRNSISLSLIWQINRHLFGNLSESYIDNNSTQDDASYEEATTSLGLSYQF